MTDKLHIKNKITGQHEAITQRDLEVKTWWLEFTVDTELEAYKAAYEYRYCQGVARVGYNQATCRWVVIVYNQAAIDAGIAK